MEENLNQQKPKSKWLKYFLTSILLLALVGAYVTSLVLIPTANFPKNTTFTIQNGDSLKTVSLNLEKENIIKSPFIFQTISVAFGKEGAVKAGDYLFEEPVNLLGVVQKIIVGDGGVNSSKITIPEGVTNREISRILAQNLSDFDQAKFLIAAQGKEGYLFPDTYFFFSKIEPQKVVDILSDTYTKKILKFKEEIENSGKTESEIIIMASILEKEASGEEDIYKISGILWRRIEKGIPLQADATITYLTGRPSSKITLADLAIDSKWNTYKYKGLPIAPIGNPGTKAIDAALNPEKSDYLYYLHGTDGIARYGRTFDEHKKNKSLYLR